MKRASLHNKRYRQRHYDRYAYLNLKHNAKRRGHFFDLTFEQFKQVWQRGKTIDRIDPTKGYTMLNVVCVTLSFNSKKGATFDKFVHTMQRERFTVPIECPI